MANETITNPQNQGTFLATVTFPELTDYANRYFLTVGTKIIPVAKSLFMTDTMGEGEGEIKLLEEFDTTTYARAKAQGADAKKMALGIGYSITIRAKRIGIESEVTWEMRRYNKYKQVLATITALPDFCPQRVELDLTHTLTFCSSTSMVDMDGNTRDLTVGDGLALASTVHTLKFSSLTYSNRVSGDPLFSKGSLEAAELLTTTDILSNFGEKRVMDFNTIITGNNPTVLNAINQFLKSTSDNTQNNAGVVNVNQNKYRLVSLPQLATTATGAIDSTKKNWWFLAAIGGNLTGWQAWYVEWDGMSLTPSTVGNGVDVHKDVWYYNVRQAYNIGVVSGRGLIASLPTS